jgi:LacI family transcriptional regulator
MAREAVRLLIEQIRGKRGRAAPQPVHKLLKFTLVKRDSTAQVKTPAPDKPAARPKGKS